MAEPRVPGNRDTTLVLVCGERISSHELNMGMREFDCACGETHAVVMDVHPPTRFIPPFLVEAIQESVEVTDEFGEFGMPHLMGLVVEEFPDEVTVQDTSDDGFVGWALVWVTAFDARRLHEIVVELVIEFMEHAMSHADDQTLVSDFEEQMFSFDVCEFVEEYRQDRDISIEDVPGAEGP